MVPVETTDNLIYNTAQTYYYVVIESLCEIIKAVQQGQRTSLVSLARVIVNQKETIQNYQTLSNLHTQMQEIQSKLNEQINQVKQQTSKHLDRIDRQAITTYTTILEIKSQMYKIESSLEGQNLSTEQPERQGFIFPEDITELHAPDSDEIFNSEEEATTTVTGIEERQTQ